VELDIAVARQSDSEDDNEDDNEDEEGKEDEQGAAWGPEGTLIQQEEESMARRAASLGWAIGWQPSLRTDDRRLAGDLFPPWTSGRYYLEAGPF
jgi:hypothetical protein